MRSSGYCLHYAFEICKVKENENTESIKKEKKKFKLKEAIAIEAWPVVLANIFCGICFTAIMMNLLVFDEKIGLGVFAVWMSLYNGCNMFTQCFGWNCCG